MGPKHPVTAEDVETNPDKMRKLSAFRENAKRMTPESSVQRVYKVFNDLHEFEVAAVQAVAELRRYLDEHRDSSEPQQSEEVAETDSIPAPPAFYAEPPYIGSHKFVGRDAQLQTLSDWAAAANPHPVLLFEAIGGSGKSMLTWEWTTKQATNVRKDWAGRFWYSFYEKGAVMADFCGRALAYMTGRPLKEFRRKKTAALSELLLHQLRAQPWLLILDGLERVLVAYHRYDAAQVPDEDAGGSDQIARRDPCAAISPDDDELLFALASASPSKLLITSRLVPRVLLNRSTQPIPGVFHERLPGLRPSDAELLLRSCGITGNSKEIQDYLTTHCDCHPLVTGVLAGLINDYLPDRGNFDAWVDDANGGAALNLAALDLIQKRNHILRAALDALPEKSRELLSTLALLSESVDYVTLSAFNPHVPPPPEEVAEPEKPEDQWGWKYMTDEVKAQIGEQYSANLERWANYERSVDTWRRSKEVEIASQRLAESVRDLERRGLLQYDTGARRYDLHPVVRGITTGDLRQEQKERYGHKVIDYFSRESRSHYESAETLDDLRGGLQCVRTLIQIGKYQEAVDIFRGDLANAFLFNLEASASLLSLLRPFFREGWHQLPGAVSMDDAAYLATCASRALERIGELEEALGAQEVGLRADLHESDCQSLNCSLANIGHIILEQNRVAAAARVLHHELESAAFLEKSFLFTSRLSRFRYLVLIGAMPDAEKMWARLDPMSRDWPRGIYRQGGAELDYAVFRYKRGDLDEEILVHAEKQIKIGRDRSLLRALHTLRGRWHLDHGIWELAAEGLHEAVRMAREIEQSDHESETLLTLANLHLRRLADPRAHAESLSNVKNPAHGDLAALWLALGDPEQAKKHALAAYKWAWADGEPYARRHELEKVRALLKQLGAEIPNLPPYDPLKGERFQWEDEVAAAIERLRAKKFKDGDASA